VALVSSFWNMRRMLRVSRAEFSNSTNAYTGALPSLKSSPATGSRFWILCATTKRFNLSPSLAPLISRLGSLLPLEDLGDVETADDATGSTDGAALITLAMLLKLAAGAGTLTLAAARSASATVMPRELLQATPANENPTANIAAPNALIATQRESSMPTMNRTSAGRKRRLLQLFSKAQAKQHLAKFSDFWASCVFFSPQPVSGGPQPLAAARACCQPSARLEWMNRAQGWGRFRCGAIGLLMASCAAQQPAPPPAQTTLAVSAAPAPVTPPEQERGGARFLDAIPADLSPELAQQLGFLSDVCNVALHYETEGAHRTRVGCRSCPPFEGAAAVSDGRIAVDGKDFFELELFLSGHFTAPDADQRLAVFNGCEPHSENRGGTLIAERRGDKFRSLRYHSGLHPQACQAYHRPDGRDLAVCEFADAHQSVSTDALSVLDFAVAPPKEQALLTFSSQDPCQTDPGTRSSEELIENFELNQNPAAKNNGLIVRTTRLDRNLDERYQRYCRESAAGTTSAERPFAKPQVTVHQYRFDGESFVPR